MDKQHKLKISKSLKGKPKSEETKEKMRQAKLGKKRSQETKDKISLGNKGKKRSETTKAKMSKALSGRKLSEETKEKIRQARLGKKSKNRVYTQKLDIKGYCGTCKKVQFLVNKKEDFNKKGTPIIRGKCKVCDRNLVVFKKKVV